MSHSLLLQRVRFLSRNNSNLSGGNWYLKPTPNFCYWVTRKWV